MRTSRRLLLTLCLLAGLLSLAFLLAPATPAAVDVAMQRRDVGTFYIRGALQGYGDLDLLVDTGSSYLVINESILASLQKAGHARFSRELLGRMADGTQRITPVYRLSGVRLGEFCWVHDVEAAVMPGSTRTILGMNILSRLSPFTFTAAPPQLALHQCQTLIPGALLAYDR